MGGGDTGSCLNQRPRAKNQRKAAVNAGLNEEVVVALLLLLKGI